MIGQEQNIDDEKTLKSGEIWEEIFYEGEHTDMAGNRKAWPLEKIKAIAEYSNKLAESGKHLAEAVIGHPRAKTPGLGKFDNYKIIGKSLFGRAREAATPLIDWIKGGHCSGLSVRIKEDGEGAYIDHVGYLPRDMEPSLPLYRSALAAFGIPRIDPEADLAGCYEFQYSKIPQLGETKVMDKSDEKNTEMEAKVREAEAKAAQMEATARAAEERIQKLEADFAKREKDLRTKEFQVFAKEAALPTHADRIVWVMEAIHGDANIHEFASGGKETPLDAFKTLLGEFRKEREALAPKDSGKGVNRRVGADGVPVGDGVPESDEKFDFGRNGAASDEDEARLMKQAAQIAKQKNTSVLKEFRRLAAQERRVK